ncbi:TetR/AcrR family transcriptional regulator [Alloalcanivorax gelatiniphagus]
MTASGAAADSHRSGQHRQSIIAAAADLTTRSGWAQVTMARLADEVGVSRQTVYNDVGSKKALAEAMVHDEFTRFLTVVEHAFDAHPDDLVQSIRAAARDVLELAHGNALLRAVVSATHGADTELLPLLTTQAQPLLSAAKTVTVERLVPFELSFTERELGAAVDLFVRAVLSHVMQPTGTPHETADDIAWVVSRTLHREA